MRDKPIGANQNIVTISNIKEWWTQTDSQSEALCQSSLWMWFVFSEHIQSKENIVNHWFNQDWNNVDSYLYLQINHFFL